MKMKLTVTKLVRGRRTGSILVLVCALLVLLALIGTAYLSTTRIDRSSTQQHTVNTETDLLLDGVCNMVQGAVVGGLFDGASYRPAPVQGVAPNYRHYDSYWDNTVATATLRSNLYNSWLASRIPERAGANPIWRTISLPLTYDGGSSIQFDRPDNPTGYSYMTASSPAVPKLELGFEPTFTTINGKTYPALIPYEKGVRKAGSVFPAADTEGDGIADAGLFKIPGGTINGVTYYAGVRVIDNSSAVNVNTAWDRNYEYDLASTPAALPAPNYFFFPSSVGLYNLLLTPGQLGNLYSYRTHGAAIAGALKDDGTAAGFNFLSLGDAFYMQLGRRLDNPGMVTASTKFQSLSVSEQLALSYGFCLRNPQASKSVLETNLPGSIYTYINTKTGPYAGGSAPVDWFTDNFANYADTSFGTLPKSIRPFLTVRNPVSNLIPAKPFPTGYTAGAAGYMAAGSTTPCKTSINTAKFAELWRGFYNVMAERNGAGQPVVPTGTDTRMFRQPLRMAGTMTSLQVLQLRAAMAAVNAEAMRTAGNNSIGHKITIPADGAAPEYKALVNGCAPQAFITEVVVDFSTAASNNVFVAVELFNPYSVPILLTNCKIGKLDHAVGGTTLSDFGYAFPAGTTVPAGGYLVLTTDATVPTPADITPITGTVIKVPNLEQMIGHEMVLMRPRNIDGTLSAGDGYNETAFLDLMPFDQISFKSIVPPVSGTAKRWQYVRPNSAAGWNFVYGGGFDGSGGQIFADKTGTAIASLGSADAMGTVSPNFVIQWSPLNWAGATVTQYPFGGFARNGDILNVPFMGSYTLLDTAGTAPVEVNSVSADSFYAEDADNTDDASEQIGRFCSVKAFDPAYAGTDHYDWASRLVDYLTVQNPNDDYLPNKYGAVDAVANVNPLVKNTVSAVLNEDTVPVEGLVNINTASWKVLSMLPLVVDASGNVDPTNTDLLAQAIVAYRDANGPFKTIFDLNRVPNFQTPTGFKDDQNHGDMQPLTGVTDYKAKFLQVTRLSNLITTRSDSFTCYVVVQGWRDAGMSNATMVSQRRMMMLLDRSNVTATNKDPKVVKVPMNQ